MIFSLEVEIAASAYSYRTILAVAVVAIALAAVVLPLHAFVLAADVVPRAVVLPRLFLLYSSTQ